MYRVKGVTFITDTDILQKKKAGSIDDIVNDYLADNPNLEPVSIMSEFKPYGGPKKGIGHGTYTISCWFKYRTDG